MSEKQQRILNCIDKWMGLREQGVSLTKYCKDRDINAVGVYGYGRLGKHLVWELKNEGFCVPWIMDNRRDSISLKYEECRLLLPDEAEQIKGEDIVIVTAIDDYYDIEAKLCKYTNVEVISLEQLIKIFIEG